MARRQRSPITGKPSARPAGKPGYLLVKENLRRIPSPPLVSDNCKEQYRGLAVCVFSGMAESFGPMLVLKSKSKSKTKPWGGAVPPPAGRPLAQVQERAGRITPSSSFSMSSDRLILDRVGRHQSPSPLHRHTQINMHFSETRGKEDISTLPGRGHFYFALTRQDLWCGGKVIMSSLSKVEMSS